MIELAEARVLADQMNHCIKGKRIQNVITGQSPHKFAFFHGDPQNYKTLLQNKIIGEAAAHGGQLEIEIEDVFLLFGDGVNLLYHETGEKRPLKHQLLIEFEDGSALSGSVQMYGFLSCFAKNECDNPYYLIAKEKPSPLSDAFHMNYFIDILSAPGADKLSAKAILATEQRIPGLGNGVLQDILYNARIHPKRKVKTLSAAERDQLYLSVRTTLNEMVSQGGRDTEKDLFGKSGGYITKLSKNTVGKPCPICGEMIQKEAYLGGSIYYCSGCQRME